DDDVVARRTGARRWRSRQSKAFPVPSSVREAGGKGSCDLFGMADSNQPPEKPRPREPEGQEFQRDGHVSGGSRRFRTPSGRPPPPERSTPRLGRHRRSPPEARVPRRPPGFAESRPEAPAPPLLENLAERRVLPPERSTPRLGAKWRNGAEDEPPAVSRAEAPEATASETEAAESSLAARTVLTERRK